MCTSNVSSTWEQPGCLFPRSSRQTRHAVPWRDRKSTRLNSSHMSISYAVFCLKKKKYLTSLRTSSVMNSPPPYVTRPLLPHPAPPSCAHPYIILPQTGAPHPQSHANSYSSSQI